ncbi:MAG: AAA family ATPase [Propionibacteriaceae bacterium]|nr:AAA family ATPase [Propionibacteriaceae bacterium]
MTGPPGVGKTTMGRALARALQAALLDLDVMTNPLVDVIAEQVGVPGDYADPDLARVVRGPRYACLVDTAVDCLEARVPVVLVAPFTKERTDEAAWAKLAGALGNAGGQAHMVWLRADGDLVRARMTERGALRDRVMLDSIAHGQSDIATAMPVVPHVEVDAATGVAEQVAAVLAALEQEQL